MKKGQWVSVQEMEGAIQKVLAYDGGPVAVTERGTFFGYGDLVVDMRNLIRLRELGTAHVVFDASHAVQCPARGSGGSSSGRSQYIMPLARAAVAAGADGLFIEVHPQPEKAPSDGPSMLPLAQLMPLMREVMAIRRVLVEEGIAEGFRNSVSTK